MNVPILVDVVVVTSVVSAVTITPRVPGRHSDNRDRRPLRLLAGHRVR
ncbi:hypothetical protein OG937_01375 [Streptomyces sp. NBC_00510]